MNAHTLPNVQTLTGSSKPTGAAPSFEPVAGLQCSTAKVFSHQQMARKILDLHRKSADLADRCALSPIVKRAHGDKIELLDDELNGLVHMMWLTPARTDADRRAKLDVLIHTTCGAKLSGPIERLDWEWKMVMLLLLEFAGLRPHSETVCDILSTASLLDLSDYAIPTDPVLAAIDTHRRTFAKFSEDLHLTDGEGPKSEACSRAHERALQAVISAKPVSTEGLLAKIEHFDWYHATGDYDSVARAFPTIAAAARELMPARDAAYPAKPQSKRAKRAA